MTWNCRIGEFRRKASQIAPLAPDIAVVPECEAIADVSEFGGEAQPTFRHRCVAPTSNRGLGVFSYTGLKLSPLPVHEPLVFFSPYVAEANGHEFNVVGVWTTPKDYRQAHLGFARFRDWIEERETIVLGDFNCNGSYGGGEAWSELMELIEPLDLISAYHAWTKEPFGEESTPTYYHQGKRKSAWHVDYCFVPRSWTLKSVEIGDFDRWSKYSDHMPLMVEAQPP